jgi:hypothetical protein
MSGGGALTGLCPEWSSAPFGGLRTPPAAPASLTAHPRSKRRFLCRLPSHFEDGGVLLWSGSMGPASTLGVLLDAWPIFHGY